MGSITMEDGAELLYNHRGIGQPIVLSHGSAPNSDGWAAQMLFLASKEYRCIAHDRRGHGRSTQTWHANEMNT